MMQNLKIRQEHINERVGNFGSRKLGLDVIDRMIEAEEKKQRRGRVLCTNCRTMKSVTGSCYC
jgi:hypothetical protein